MNLSSKLTHEFYMYDDNLIDIANKLFKAHNLNAPAKDKFALITDLIRYNAANDISEESPLSWVITSKKQYVTPT